MHLSINITRANALIVLTCLSMLCSNAFAQKTPKSMLLDCDPSLQECIDAGPRADVKFLPDYQTECDKRITDQGMSCQSDDILCVGQNQEFSAIQDAIDSSQPGDAICIRAGEYPLSGKPGLRIDVNGTSQNRIFLEPYPSEAVAIVGGGSAAAWDNLTDQKPAAGFEQNGIEISGDYITVRGFEISYFGDSGIEIAGDHVTIEGMHVHNNWFDGISLSGLGNFDGGDILNGTIRYNWVHNMRHGYGLRLVPPSNRVTRINDSRIEYNLSYWNGYEPDGQKVPTIPGDPAGGGNSDAAGASKTCSYSDNTAIGGSGNMCQRTAFMFNIGWENADDCYDFSQDEYMFWGNIGWNCGPEGGRGMKQLRAGRGPSIIVGNFLHGGGPNQQVVGFEPRQEAGQFQFLNNGAVFHTNQGMLFSIAGVSNQSSRFSNNMSWQNGSDNFGNVNLPGGNNWTQGDPALDSCSPVLNVPTGLLAMQADGKMRWELVYGQVSDSCRPAAGSPLIDAGEFVPEIHCAKADDDPVDPYDQTDGSCWHWKGAAPDIGPFER